MSDKCGCAGGTDHNKHTPELRHRSQSTPPQGQGWSPAGRPRHVQTAAAEHGSHQQRACRHPRASVRKSPRGAPPSTVVHPLSSCAHRTQRRRNVNARYVCDTVVDTNVQARQLRARRIFTARVQHSHTRTARHNVDETGGVKDAVSRHHSPTAAQQGFSFSHAQRYHGMRMRTLASPPLQPCYSIIGATHHPSR